MKLKQNLFYLNVGILIILVCVLLTNYDSMEGITNMNCCGGIQLGVHYQETDKSPPEYIRRCFKSSREDGSVVYDWNSFPCTTEDGGQCCPDVPESECIPTTGGGYCKSDGGNKIYRRGESTHSPYIRRGGDTTLDITNSIDMEDYFYDRSGGGGQTVSPEMQSFLDRRDRNSQYIQSHLVEASRNRVQRMTRLRTEAESERKTQQIKNTIVFIHLLFVIGFAIVIKDLIIQDIADFYTMLGVRYSEFTGKAVSP